MTRKDYELIADVLRTTDLPGNIRSLLALNFAFVLKQGNPRFKPVRFCMATMPTSTESEAIKANNAEGFEAGRIEHWIAVDK
jgi:hypothetical protein